MPFANAPEAGCAKQCLRRVAPSSTRNARISINDSRDCRPVRVSQALRHGRHEPVVHQAPHWQWHGDLFGRFSLNPSRSRKPTRSNLLAATIGPYVCRPARRTTTPSAPPEIYSGEAFAVLQVVLNQAVSSAGALNRSIVPFSLRAAMSVLRRRSSSSGNCAATTNPGFPHQNPPSAAEKRSTHQSPRQLSFSFLPTNLALLKPCSQRSPLWECHVEPRGFGGVRDLLFAHAAPYL
jgi:hypothetical protein